MPLALPPPSVGLATGSSTEIDVGTRKSVPSGIESIIEYNGVYLNNRSWIETFVVNSIGGLEDPDLRDDREVNPQQHGETAFNAFYGGRTITLTGYIRAFTIHKLRDMQQALKQAFATLEESPMIFRAWDDPVAHYQINCRKGGSLQMNEEQPVDSWFRRDFMITMRASNPRFRGIIGRSEVIALGIIDGFGADSSASYDKTGSAHSISGGKLVPGSTAVARWLRNDFALWLTDTEVVVKYESATTFTASGVAGMMRASDTANGLLGQINAAGVLLVAKIVGGTTTVLSTGPTVPARSAGNSYWLRVRCVGNDVTVEHWITDPRAGGTVTTSHTYTLTGSDAIAFGDEVAGMAGIQMLSPNTSWRYDDLSITPYNLNSVIATIHNNGNFGAQPEITFTGPLSDPILSFDTSGEIMQLTGDITYDNPWIANIAGRTLKDSVGVNQFANLAFNSDWPEVPPGITDVALTATGVSPFVSGGLVHLPEVRLYYFDTWL